MQSLLMLAILGEAFGSMIYRHEADKRAREKNEINTMIASKQYRFGGVPQFCLQKMRFFVLGPSPLTGTRM